MDDLDPEIKNEVVEDEDLDSDIDDLISSGKKGPKKAEDDSLDILADEEDEALPEDSFDDVDLW